MDRSNLDESSLLTYDYGIPAAVRDTRKKYQKQLAVYLILASTLFERTAFYTLGAHLTVILQLPNFLHWNPTNSAIASNIFSGTSNVSTLIFAIISDWKLGRAKTIVVGFLIYLIGYVFAALATNPNMNICGNSTLDPISALNTTTLSQEPCVGQMLGVLIIIAVGAGAVQANMAVFGAEQIQRSKLTSRYFEKYMVAINIGAMLATLAIPFDPNENERNIFTECVIAASILFLAAVLFFAGWRYYIHINSNETVVTKCIPVIISAFRSWRQHKKNKRSIVREASISSSSDLLNVSQSLTEKERSIRIDERPPSFLDFAKVANLGKFHDRIVNDVKSLRSAIVVFSLLTPYWLLYNQMYATFPLQGQHMKEADDKQMLVTRMWLGDPVTIIVGILILNLFVYRHLATPNKSWPVANKFVVGMCFACISMLIAGTIEIFRRENCDSISGKSSVSLYYQLLENIFMGFSEIFAMVASYEYAYFAAPRSAQSLFMSLRFCSIGVSSFISAAYVAVFPIPSFRMDFSCRIESKLQWSFYTYFFILAGLQLIFIIIFLKCENKFGITKLHPEKLKESQSH